MVSCLPQNVDCLHNLPFLLSQLLLVCGRSSVRWSFRNGSYEAHSLPETCSHFVGMSPAVNTCWEGGMLVKFVR